MKLSIRKRPTLRIRKKVTDEKREYLFTRYKPIVHKLANKYHRLYGRPVQELVDVGMSSLGNCAMKWDSYDAKKSKEVTWIYQNVYWSMRCHCDQFTKRREVPLLLEEADRPQKTTWLETIWRELSTEGRALLKTILEAPGELASVFYTPAKTEPGERKCTRVRIAPVSQRRALRKHLSESGWTEAEIEKAWRDVEEAL